MNTTILKGNIISADRPEAVTIIENGFLIAIDGNIEGLYPSLPDRFSSLPVEDYGDALILQSFSDMHLHAPQYPLLGMSMDKELLEWLHDYVFPTEACMSDPSFARTAYRALAKELLQNGTTRVSMFSSLHKEATLILMEELEKAGISGYVGKVNMDRNSIPELCETTKESMEQTLSWLDECGQFKNIKPILTPRFTPSCTNELMAFLGRLAEERQLPVQSHLSENRSELAWVRELHPDCAYYWQTYEKYGLWNHRTLMAHCVWSDANEQRAMKEAGVTVVHCADSNVNLTSGIAPIRDMTENGLRVTLGSDISAGDHLNGFDVVASTIRSSNMRSVFAENAPRPLTISEAWYLGVSAPASFFGEKPGLAPGNMLNAMVVSDHDLLSARPLTVKERFERLFYRRQPDAVKALYGNGKKLICFNLSPK